MILKNHTPARRIKNWWMGLWGYDPEERMASTGYPGDFEQVTVYRPKKSPEKRPPTPDGGSGVRSISDEDIRAVLEYFDQVCEYFGQACEEIQKVIRGENNGKHNQ